LILTKVLAGQHLEGAARRSVDQERVVIKRADQRDDHFAIRVLAKCGRGLGPHIRISLILNGEKPDERIDGCGVVDALQGPHTLKANVAIRLGQQRQNEFGMGRVAMHA